MYWNVDFCTICEIIFLVGSPWKSNVVLEKSLKMVAIFGMNPDYVIALLFKRDRKTQHHIML